MKHFTTDRETLHDTYRQRPLPGRIISSLKAVIPTTYLYRKPAVWNFMWIVLSVKELTNIISSKSQNELSSDQSVWMNYE